MTNRTDEDYRGQSRIERYFQHIVQGLTVLAIGGGWNMLQEMKDANSQMATAIAVIQTQNAQMDKRLDDFKILMGDRYTSANARAAHDAINGILQDYEQRLRRIEGQR